jgi:hypothetical protein
MRFNAAAKASALLKAGVLSTLACTIGLSNFAIAEELPLSVTGGQVCQAANLSQAQIGGGIVWLYVMGHLCINHWLHCRLGDKRTRYSEEHYRGIASG